MLLTVNMILSFEEGHLERVIWIDSFYENLFAFNINQNSSKLALRKTKDLEEAIRSGTVQIEKEDRFITTVKSEEIKESSKKKRDESYEIVKEIYAEPAIFNPKDRRQLILEACDKFGVTEKTVYKYLKKYWRGGMNKNSLLPDFEKCGGKGTEKGAGKVKRGRPRKYYEEEQEGININEEMKKIFRVGLKKYYYNTKQNSLITAFELIKKDFFTEDYKIQNGIKIPIVKDGNKLPTIGQFRYWFEKERDLKKEVCKREGYKKFQLNNRALVGDSTIEVFGPGSLYQIDATIVDLYLVSRYRKDWIIGRPILYVVIDTFSRMIVGLYVGLEGPSWIGAMMALVNAASDKVEFCKEYGVEIDSEDWPVSYMPDAIIADRGEFEGKVSDGLIEGLNVKLQNTSSYRGDMKAIVERYFNTVHSHIKPFAPGYIRKDYRERGAKDYRLDASLDIYQFTKIMIKCALYDNNQNYLKSYKCSKEMVRDSVEPVALKIWEWGIKNRSGMLRSFSEDLVKLNLMPTKEGTVTERGVKFKGMYYSSEVAMKERWFEKARTYGSWKVDICYDMRNVNYAYMKNADNRGFEKLFLLESQEKYRDKTLDEIQQLQSMEKSSFRSAEQEVVQGKIDLMAEIESIVNEAKKESYCNEPKSNRQRLKNIRTNRLAEKQFERDSEKFELEKGELEQSYDGQNLISINEESQLFNIDLLKKKQKEKLDARGQNDNK